MNLTPRFHLISGYEIRGRGKSVFVDSIISTLTLKPIRPPIQKTLVVISSRIRRPGSEPHLSFPSNIRVWMLELILLLPRTCSWLGDSFQIERSLIIPFKSFPNHHLPVLRHWTVYIWYDIFVNSLQRADHSSRGVLPAVVRRCVWSRNLKNEAMTHVGSQRHRKKIIYIYI